MSLQGRKQASVRDVPYLRRIVHAPRDYLSSVEIEAGRSHRTLMALQGGKVLTSKAIPQLYSLVATGRNESGPLGAEGGG